jgi:hypothetical protein
MRSHGWGVVAFCFLTALGLGAQPPPGQPVPAA